MTTTTTSSLVSELLFGGMALGFGYLFGKDFYGWIKSHIFSETYVYILRLRNKNKDITLINGIYNKPVSIGKLIQSKKELENYVVDKIDCHHFWGVIEEH